jgi:hypothetical protein
MQERVRRAAKLGINAFNFEWDGHVQAMTRKREHWSGVAALREAEARPAVRAR